MGTPTSWSAVTSSRRFSGGVPRSSTTNIAASTSPGTRRAPRRRRRSRRPCDRRCPNAARRNAGTARRHRAARSGDPRGGSGAPRRRWRRRARAGRGHRPRGRRVRRRLRSRPAAAQRSWPMSGSESGRAENSRVERRLAMASSSGIPPPVSGAGSRTGTPKRAPGSRSRSGTCCAQATSSTNRVAAAALRHARHRHPAGRTAGPSVARASARPPAAERDRRSENDQPDDRDDPPVDVEEECVVRICEQQAQREHSGDREAEADRGDRARQGTQRRARGCAGRDRTARTIATDVATAPTARSAPASSVRRFTAVGHSSVRTSGAGRRSADRRDPARTRPANPPARSSR